MGNYHQFNQNKDIMIGTWREEKEFMNLFRPELLSLFPNAESMIIRSVIYSFSMSMTNLLALISTSNLKKVIIKTMKKEGNNWIETLWNLEKDILTKQYAEKDYNISVVDEDGITANRPMSM